ncbi:hypothetical protein F5887DRAFT_7931 [Amanita rubescens]|nr:hypothetical protein F5887DRAFT_7931 [Amanita rubescens]
MLPQPGEIGEIAPASTSALLPASVPPPALSTGSSSVQGCSEDVGTSKAVKRKRDDDSSNERRANSPLAPEASSVPPSTIRPGLRKSSRIAVKKQKPDDPVCSSVIRTARQGGGRKGGHKDGSGGSKKSKEGEYRGGSVRKKMAIPAHEMAEKSTLELASGRNVLLLYLQYGIYDSSAPSTFVRHPTPLPSRETVRNYQLEECLTIVLKSEIGHGATGEVLRGTLVVEASECPSLDVAVKLALGSKQCGALRDEYRIYHQLRSKGVTTGITTPLGLFDDVEGGVCILVMPYVGAPLAATPELSLAHFISGSSSCNFGRNTSLPIYSTAIFVWTTYLWLIRV